MGELTPHILWGINERTEYQSIEQLDQLIDELSNAAKNKSAFSIQIIANEKTALLITLGGSESHMEYYDAQQRPPVVGCRGNMEDDEIITFLHGGEPSEIEKRYCVDISDAREAVRIYVMTGKRPENISWGE